MDYFLSPENYSWKNALLWGNFVGHCKQAQQGSFKNRLVHSVIAAVEFLPGVSQIASIFEKTLASYKTPKNLDAQRVKVPPSDASSQTTMAHLFNPGGSSKKPSAPPNSTPSQTAPVAQISNPNRGEKKTPNELVSAFYRNEGPDTQGRTLAQMWAFTDSEKERKHDYIQWLFPLNNQSQFNANAPVLDRKLLKEMKQDRQISANLRHSFVLMLNFYGLNYDPQTKKVAFAPNFKERATNWLTPNNHNFLRITRILTCLRNFGLSEEAQAFLDKLAEIHKQHSAIIGNSYQFWQKVISPH